MSCANSKSVDDEGDKILAPKLFFANKHKPYVEFKLEVALLWPSLTLSSRAHFCAMAAHGHAREQVWMLRKRKDLAYNGAGRQLLTRIPSSCPLPTVLHSKWNWQRLEGRRRQREGRKLPWLCRLFCLPSLFQILQPQEAVISVLISQRRKQSNRISAPYHLGGLCIDRQMYMYICMYIYI